VRTLAGWVYAAFVIDVYSRMVVAWKADSTMRADLVTDTLNMAACAGGRAGVTSPEGLMHHTDAGQSARLGRVHRTPGGNRYRGLDRRGRRRLRQRAGLVPDRPVQDRADRRSGPRRALEDVEIASLEWVDPEAAEVFITGFEPGTP